MKYVLNNVSCLTFFDKVISKPIHNKKFFKLWLKNVYKKLTFICIYNIIIVYTMIYIYIILLDILIKSNNEKQIIIIY